MINVEELKDVLVQDKGTKCIDFSSRVCVALENCCTAF